MISSAVSTACASDCSSFEQNRTDTVLCYYKTFAGRLLRLGHHCNSRFVIIAKIDLNPLCAGAGRPASAQLHARLQRRRRPAAAAAGCGCRWSCGWRSESGRRGGPGGRCAAGTAPGAAGAGIPADAALSARRAVHRRRCGPGLPISFLPIPPLLPPPSPSPPARALARTNAERR